MAINDAQFEQSFRQSPVPRLMVEVRPGGVFACAEVNKAAADYFERSAQDMQGKTCAQLFDTEMAEHLEQSLRTCLKVGAPVSAKAPPRFPGSVQQGRVFMFSPLKNGDGGIHFIDVFIVPDFSDEKQLQREREDVILLLTSIFDASSLGIIVTDRHGRMVRVNDAFLKEFGWDRQKLIGDFFTMVIPDRERDLAAQRHEDFLQNGKIASREIRILRGNGERADVLVNMALLEMSQRRRFVVATFQDITALKEMKEVLRIAKDEADSANRAKSAFLANMSHELRTPLNAIIGFSELIKNATFGPVQNEKYVDYITDIHFSARHLLDIINDVLDMSKIEAGKVELIESEICLGEIFQSVLRIMSDRAAAEKVTLKIDLAPDLPHLKADQRLLRQMLLNLVSNAVKFSPPGQTVCLAGMQHQGGIRLSVLDNGCGIPQDKLTHVLEPFGQVAEPSHSKSQGTGLGLPLAKAMIELHEGSLTLLSELGKGTQVHLDFPASRILMAHKHNSGHAHH